MERPGPPAAALLAVFFVAGPAPSPAAPEGGADPVARFEQGLAAAEKSLRESDPQSAERRYRSVLSEGWLLLGTLERLEDRPEEAVRMLEEARSSAPDDSELAYATATAYLRLKRVAPAERLFAQVVRDRPLPLTHVLIGRTYRDAGEYDRARAELRAALALDPRVRRAHYYLGMVILAAEGATGLERAIAEFREELKLEPRDALANTQLGMALVEARRADEALPALEIAARASPDEPRIHYYLGRSQVALDRTAEGAASLGRALDLARRQGADAPALRAIHMQLAPALRALGRTTEAETHFSEAARLSAEVASAERTSMARYLADVVDPAEPRIPVLPMEDSPLAALPPSQRNELRGRVRSGLARAYLNLGVMQAQAESFARAAELFEKAAELDSDLPRVQYSLGVAYFNAKRYDQATGPLLRALAATPGDAGLGRMLAMSWLNTGEFAKAAELLKDDPERGRDPSLQFAYGLALVRSGRAAEAEREFEIFRQLKDKKH